MSAGGLRRALAAVVAFDLLCFVAFVPAAAERAAAAGIEAPAWAGLSTSPVALVAAVAIGLFAAARFARRGSIAGGAVALVILGLLSHAHAALDGSPWRHLYYSGLCLLGWLVGAAYARARARGDEPRHAIAGATALLGAAYFSAGLSKLVFSGPDWLAGETLRHAVVAQDGLVGAGTLHALRVAVVERPGVAAALATATVAVELAGAALLAGPRVRAAAAAGLVAMHAAIFVLTGIAYVESVALLVLFGWPRRAEPTAPSEAPGPRATAIVGAALGLAATAAIVHQGLAAAEAPGPAAIVQAPTRVLGPFRVGEARGGLEVVELAASGDAMTVFVAGAAGRVGFDLTCRETADVGPFDRPPLHVFYRPTPLSQAEIAGAGAAVRDAALAAGAPDVCAALQRWIGSAG